MATLAFRGHKSRGEEFIQVLEMLGGENKLKLNGSDETLIYFIDDSFLLALKIEEAKLSEFMVFTLEEFLEKYPYKVGDKVLHKDDNICQSYGIIEDMLWDKDENIMFYRIFFKNSFWYSFDEIKFYLHNKEAEKHKIQIPEFPQSINLSQTNVNEIEVVLGDYEFTLKDGKTYFVKKKPKYPKDYEECCEVLGISDNRGFGFINLSECENILMSSFIQLKRCCNAYWKIAGEELGLDKPWEPDWNDCAQRKFGLYTLENEIRCINLQVLKNIILVFPTEEIRDTFYENFKDLINQCKELL